MASFVSPNIVTDDLILHLDAANTKSYPGSGTTWTDLSGKNNNGTLTNGPTFSSDNMGGIVFDGTNDHVVLDTSFQVSTSLTYSVEAWIFKTGVATNNIGILISGGFGGDKDGIIIGTEQFDTTDVKIIAVDNNINAIYYNGISQPLSGSQTNVSFNLNEWIHVAVTGITVNDTDGAAHHIAQNNNNTNEYTGRIANLKVYDRELTATEVKQNYDALRGRFGL